MPRSVAAYLADILDASEAIDETVYALARTDLAELGRECTVLLERTGEAD